MIQERESPPLNGLPTTRNETTPTSISLTPEQIEFAQMVGRLLAEMWDEENKLTILSNRVSSNFLSSA